MSCGQDHLPYYLTAYGIAARLEALQSEQEESEATPPPPGAKGKACRENPPYYITAYALAVRRGFTGSLDDWLASLKGEAALLQYNTETGTIQWRNGTDEDWTDLVALSVLQEGAVADVLAQTQGDAEAAAASETGAAASATAAASSATDAASSATAAAGSASEAATSADNAATSATEAAASAAEALSDAKWAQNAGTEAETAATAAANSATEAASSATEAASSASAAAESETNADSSATAAAASAENAAKAQAAVESMTVEAVTLTAGSDATVEKELVDDAYKFTFGIPRGEKGEPGLEANRGTLALQQENWANGTQTVSAPGVTADNVVLVAPAPSSYEAYTTAHVYCSAQSEGELTFAYMTEPEQDLLVNILCWEVTA